VQGIFSGLALPRIPGGTAPRGGKWIESFCFFFQKEVLFFSEKRTEDLCPLLWWR
jgi:hypothetical protein